jgi:hypothetical protein
MLNLNPPHGNNKKKKGRQDGDPVLEGQRAFVSKPSLLPWAFMNYSLTPSDDVQAGDLHLHILNVSMCCNIHLLQSTSFHISKNTWAIKRM